MNKKPLQQCMHMLYKHGPPEEEDGDKSKQKHAHASQNKVLLTRMNPLTNISETKSSTVTFAKHIHIRYCPFKTRIKRDEIEENKRILQCEHNQCA